MKRYLLPLALLPAACHPDQPAATAPPTAAPTSTATATTSPASPVAAGDTLRLYDSLQHLAGVVRLRPSTRAAFDALRANDPLPTRPSEAQNAADAPLPADHRVRRQGNRLVFRPSQGPAVTLTPKPGSDEGPQGLEIGYYYWGSLPASHQWVVDVVGDEGGSTALIDQRTGRRTDVLGYPAVSPDGRYLLSTTEDVASGGLPTALTLYHLRDGQLGAQVWTRDLTEWGPYRARWRDARHVLLERHYPPQDGLITSPASPPTFDELELPARP